VLCGCFFAGVSLQAHHSLAGVYDIRQDAQVQGTLISLKFTNPHGSLHLGVKNNDGSTTEWVFTTGSATTLAERGIGKNSNVLKAGDQVTVKYAPARDGSPLGFLKSITTPDGKVINISAGAASD
jgi:hypothetical protein